MIQLYIPLVKISPGSLGGPVPKPHNRRWRSAAPPRHSCGANSVRAQRGGAGGEARRGHSKLKIKAVQSELMEGGETLPLPAPTHPASA